MTAPDSPHPPESTTAAHSPVPYVRAAGSRYAIGFEHGRQVRDLVHGTLDWSVSQLEVGGVTHADGLRRALLLLEFVRAQTPELVDEVRGIADGAGLELAEAALINTRYELLFLNGSDQPRSGVPGAECTLFGVEGRRTTDGQPIIGQNVDLSPASEPYWVMLDVQPDGGPRVLTATLAGMLAQEGINAFGLALCGSMIRCAGWRAGYPTRKFLRRRVLEQPDVAAAIDVIRATRQRASSHNLLLADASGRLADVETTVDAVHVLEPEGGVMAHANHYLAAECEGENAVIGEYVHNTTARCARMRAQLDAADAPFSIERLQELLRDHTDGPRAICRHAALDDSGAETNVAVISEPARRRMHVAFGPPCQTPFVTYALDS